jgi:type VI secretion system protein ImpF
MADKSPPQERLQPSLLDRLTDDQPGTTHESIEARVLSTRRLRQAVLRDLTWLFNATHLEAVADLRHVPYVRQSVLNFGLPALAGKGATSLDLADLTSAIRAAIVNFEPRISPATLRVTTLLEPGQLDHHNVIGVQIQGQLQAQPVSLDFLVRTDFDLETGKVQIVDLEPPWVE